MDISALIDQLVATVQDAPEKINEILADPKAAIEDITGQQLGEGDLSQIVAGVQEKLAAGEIDLSGIDLSQIDLSKLDLGALLGGGAGGIGGALGGIASGIGGLFGRK